MDGIPTGENTANCASQNGMAKSVKAKLVGQIAKAADVGRSVLKSITAQDGDM